jgi:DNA-binding NarL/FixJ family response regulator
MGDYLHLRTLTVAQHGELQLPCSSCFAATLSVGGKNNKTWEVPSTSVDGPFGRLGKHASSGVGPWVGVASGMVVFVEIKIVRKASTPGWTYQSGQSRRIHHQTGVIAPTAGPWPFGHDGSMNARPSAEPSQDSKSTTSETIQVLVADSSPIQSQLLTRALRARRELRVSAIALEAAALHSFMQSNHADVVLIAGNSLPDLSLLRWLHVSYPKVAPVLLVERDDREMVVNAFRAGARGLFLFHHAPFRTLCKCIIRVFHGQIWISSQQMHYLLEALSEVPTLRVVSANGRLLLTPREEQVVALVADGLSNREVAGELGLSEHTIKKYLLRIFDKLGISTRVELVLYAFSHGEKRPAEWLPGTA